MSQISMKTVTQLQQKDINPEQQESTVARNTTPIGYHSRKRRIDTRSPREFNTDD